MLPKDPIDEIAIPTVDISGERRRHVIVAQGTQQLWQGHPNTVLLPDGKTMFCVWQGRQGASEAHGAPGGLLKRSDDGGITWSEQLDVPPSWREKGRGHPTVHRLVDGKGVARLFVFSRTDARNAMVQAMSPDEGRTWTPLQENRTITYWTAPQSVVAVENGRKHRMWYERDSAGRPGPGVIWQSASLDGGITWGGSRQVVAFADARLCEPAVLRSPDGRQLLMLMRENARVYNSLYAVSNDEGQTWSRPRPLPLALTGDRHDGVYTPDGRLVIAFRDMAQGAPTYRHFVAWVGTYEDILEGRQGHYRVKLLHCHKQDTGYPGIEILADDTVVATTYVRYRPDEKHSVVSVRFNVEELDLRLKPVESP